MAYTRNRIDHLYVKEGSVKQKLCGFLLLIFAAVPGTSETLRLQDAIKLASHRSAEMAIAEANVRRATAAYLEARAQYIPQLSIGSNAGYAYGFPLGLEGSAPTLLNVTAQSSIWSPSRQEAIRAARSELNVSKLQNEDQRAQVVLETVLTYVQLQKWQEKLSVGRDQEKVAMEVERAEALRIKEGVDTVNEGTKAKLTEAEIRAEIGQTEGEIDVLKMRLSQLTGVPSTSVEIVPDSVPPILKEEETEDISLQAMRSSAAVHAADESAQAQLFRAKSEHKALYPTADFAAQYGLISTTLTNYEQFFVPHSFQPENVTVGLVLRLNFLNAGQRQRAKGADAEAVRAQKEAEEVRQRAGIEALRLKHDEDRLAAMRDAAELRYELAVSELNAANTRITTEVGSLKEFQNAALAAATRTVERIDAEFELQRAELQLLSRTGKLENWANLNH
jgi:outer membrane protein TolC